MSLAQPHSPNIWNGSKNLPAVLCMAKEDEEEGRRGGGGGERGGGGGGVGGE